MTADNGPAVPLEPEVVEDREEPDESGATADVEAIREFRALIDAAGPHVVEVLGRAFDARVKVGTATEERWKDQNAKAATVATHFLWTFAGVGVAGMVTLAWIAHTKVLSGEAFGVLATNFFTLLLGGGIFGIKLRSSGQD